MASKPRRAAPSNPQGNPPGPQNGPQNPSHGPQSAAGASSTTPNTQQPRQHHPQANPPSPGATWRSRAADTITAGLSIDWSLYSKWVRRVRMVKYGAYAAGATVSIPFPSLLVQGAFADGSGWSAFSYIWSGVFLIGAVVSLLGVLTRTWVGEYIGLVGVITALSLYTLACFTVEPTGNRVFLGLVFLGFAMSAVARRQDVGRQKKLAEYQRRVRDGRRGL